MRKNAIIVLLYLVIISVLEGCSKQNITSKENKSSDESKKINIVATIFPQYDFARQIAGDKADITMLLSPGAESHSYDPSPQDILKIQNCDMFLYVGGESDEWIDDLLQSMDTSKMTVIRLMDCVDIVEEEIVEGMEGEEEVEGKEVKEDGTEEDVDYVLQQEEAQGQEVEYDEHVWTSPKNAIRIVDKIAETLGDIDQMNQEFYEMNAKDYVKCLEQLDQEFKEVVDNAARHIIVLGDRFPFRYFADAYGLEYAAAFPGCSTETEPSVATITYLVDKIKEEQIPVVFYIEFSNHKIADSISESTGAKTLLLHSCHNISKDDFDNGITYLDLMRQNVDRLKEALK
ncbi:MAG: transporter substrate-binding protein [Herbinix sp.]|jgi:zinc transport system substrate-binding protein|nr:transporter substrate-binding protein [Herbinix sp.]